MKYNTIRNILSAYRKYGHTNKVSLEEEEEHLRSENLKNKSADEAGSKPHASLWVSIGSDVSHQVKIPFIFPVYYDKKYSFSFSS